MRGFFRDKIAVTTAAIGLILIGLAWVFRINPWEGSVIPRFLTESGLGQVVISILLAATAPVWILGGWLTTMLWPRSVLFAKEASYVVLALTQGATYFLLGMVISQSARRLKKRRRMTDGRKPGA